MSLMAVIVLTGAAGQMRSHSDTDSAVGYVSYFPNVALFSTSITYEEGFEEGPDFQSIDDAVSWIAERAPVGYVTLGSSNPVVFRVGDATFEDVDEHEEIQDWPPSPSELRRLVTDMQAAYEDSIANPSPDFPTDVSIEREGG